MLPVQKSRTCIVMSQCTFQESDIIMIRSGCLCKPAFLQQMSSSYAETLTTLNSRIDRAGLESWELQSQHIWKALCQGGCTKLFCVLFVFSIFDEISQRPACVQHEKKMLWIHITITWWLMQNYTTFQKQKPILKSCSMLTWKPRTSEIEPVHIDLKNSHNHHNSSPSPHH